MINIDKTETKHLRNGMNRIQYLQLKLIRVECTPPQYYMHTDRLIRQAEQIRESIARYEYSHL